MKQWLWSLSLTLATVVGAQGQEPSKSAATLGLPRPSAGTTSVVQPALFNSAAPPVSGPAFPAPDPIVSTPYAIAPTPYAFVDVPKTAKPADDPSNIVTPANPAPVNPAAPGGPLTPSPILVGEDQVLPLPINAPPFVTGNHFRFTSEYLMWWTSGFHAPPLVTTGPAASDGIIGQPGVSTIAGGDRVSPNSFSNGVRLGFEWFMGPRQVWGLDGHFFVLGTNTTDQIFTSNQFPLLARPFFNVNQAVPFSEIVATPGLLSGGVNIHTTTSLLGGDINLRRRLYQDCGWNIDIFGGYRYLRLADELNIQEASMVIPGATLPATFPANLVGASAFDQFKTTNNFNGSQIGFNLEATTGRWVFSLRPSVAMGITSSTLDVIGGQAVVTTTGTTTTPGGLLALNSNMGHYTKNTFAVVPEGTFNIGYNITDHCRVFVGYNVLYWSSVLRPGAQINPNLDVNRIPGFPASSPISVPQPLIPLRDQGFLAQGINIGLTFRW